MTSQNIFFKLTISIKLFLKTMRQCFEIEHDCLLIIHNAVIFLHVFGLDDGLAWILYNFMQDISKLVYHIFHMQHKDVPIPVSAHCLFFVLQVSAG